MHVCQYTILKPYSVHYEVVLKLRLDVEENWATDRYLERKAMLYIYNELMQWHHTMDLC